MRKCLTLTLAATLLAGCGTPAAPTAIVPQAARVAAAAATEAATPELMARLMAGHKAYQGRAVVGPDHKDAALLTSYDGKLLTIAGKLGASKQKGLLGLIKWVTVAAETETAGRVPFTTQEFASNSKADAFLATIPQDQPATITFKVVRFSWRSDANSPFVFVAAATK